MLMEGGIIEAKRNDEHSYKQKFQGPFGYLVPYFMGSLELLFVNYVSLVHGKEGGQ
jgi:hypothetical protein